MKKVDLTRLGFFALTLAGCLVAKKLDWNSMADLLCGVALGMAPGIPSRPAPKL